MLRRVLHDISSPAFLPVPFFLLTKPESPSKHFFYSRNPEQCTCHNTKNNHKYRQWHFINEHLMAEGFLLFSNWGWCQGWIAALFRLQTRCGISATAERTHQPGQERPQDVLMLQQGSCCALPPAAVFLSAPTFKSCLITHPPQMGKAALQISSESKYQKAPNDLR